MTIGLVLVCVMVFLFFGLFLALVALAALGIAYVVRAVWGKKAVAPTRARERESAERLGRVEAKLTAASHEKGPISGSPASEPRL